MKTYYVVFNKNGRVDLEENRTFDASYVHLKTRHREEEVLEYYVHESRAEFYREAFNV